jgi:hypothetical protein
MMQRWSDYLDELRDGGKILRPSFPAARRASWSHRSTCWRSSTVSWPNAILRLRVAAMEIVFGQLTDHSVPTEQQRQRLDNSGLSAIVGAN